MELIPKFQGERDGLPTEYEYQTERGTYKVEVQRISEREFSVTVNGKEHKLFFLNGVGDTNSLYFIVDGKLHSAGTIRESTNFASIRIDNVDVNLVKRSKASPKTVPYPLKAKRRTDENTVVAEIPGRIVSIKVRAGDTVEKDQPVAVIESMKMQAFIKAHRSGKIKKVIVQEGKNVAVGDALIIFEQESD